MVAVRPGVRTSNAPTSGRCTWSTTVNASTFGACWAARAAGSLLVVPGKASSVAACGVLAGGVLAPRIAPLYMQPMSEVTPLRRCATCDRHFEGAQFCPDDGTPLVLVAEARGEGEDAWVGRVLAGRYRVLGVLGRGGMGVVYEAEQRPFGRIVALKRLRVDRADEAKMRARFEREALAVSRLKSPWTVRLLDVVHDESGEPFIVMAVSYTHLTLPTNREV